MPRVGVELVASAARGWVRTHLVVASVHQRAFAGSGGLDAAVCGQPGEALPIVLEESGGGYVMGFSRQRVRASPVMAECESSPEMSESAQR